MKDLSVLKTYKLFINGQFPRTESGRHSKIERSGNHIANICRATRKDFRNAVKAARAAQSAWWSRTAYNRSQILYRLAEMLDARKDQIKTDLYDSLAEQADSEIQNAVNSLVSYAGWCDKYNQVFSSVNPVSGSYFNFSTLEPMGVVSVLLDERESFSDFVQLLAAILAGGNTSIFFVPNSLSLAAISFAEVIQNSDLPAGVINILTGEQQEMEEHFASHMDVNALYIGSDNQEDIQRIREGANSNLKRVFSREKLQKNFGEFSFEEKSDYSSPYLIQTFTELKTTWHPIEKIGSAAGGY